MPRELKVYGWVGMHYGIRDPENGIHSNQTRDIVAAHSVAEVTRLAGIPRSVYLWSGRETGDAEEVAQAMSSVGTVFYRPLNTRAGGWIELTKEEK